MCLGTWTNGVNWPEGVNGLIGLAIWSNLVNIGSANDVLPDGILSHIPSNQDVDPGMWTIHSAEDNFPMTKISLKIT